MHGLAFLGWIGRDNDEIANDKHPSVTLFQRETHHYRDRHFLLLYLYNSRYPLLKIYPASQHEKNEWAGQLRETSMRDRYRGEKGFVG